MIFKHAEMGGILQFKLMLAFRVSQFLRVYELRRCVSRDRARQEFDA